MKKTLVALAVLAASGASFAQVTISGNVGFGFQKGPDNTTYGTKSVTGFAQTTGDVNFAATEDLGGGMSITAATSIDVEGRQGNVGAQNTTLTLATASYSVLAGSIKAGAPIWNNAGAPINLYTGANGSLGATGATKAPLDAQSNLEALIVGFNVTPALKVSGAYAEQNVDATQALSTFAGSNNSNLSAYQLIVNYNQGPLSLNGDYSAFRTYSGTGYTDLKNANTDGYNRLRVWGSYDFGAAKIGGGVIAKNYGLANQYDISVNVPLSAKLSVGANYAMRAVQEAGTNPTVAAAEGRNALELGLGYNLSKTTVFNVSYATYGTTTTTTIPTTGGGFDMQNEYRIILTKNF